MNSQSDPNIEQLLKDIYNQQRLSNVNDYRRIDQGTGCALPFCCCGIVGCGRNKITGNTQGGCGYVRVQGSGDSAMKDIISIYGLGCHPLAVCYFDIFFGWPLFSCLYDYCCCSPPIERLLKKENRCKVRQLSQELPPMYSPMQRGSEEKNNEAEI